MITYRMACEMVSIIMNTTNLWEDPTFNKEYVTLVVFLNFAESDVMISILFVLRSIGFTIFDLLTPFH